MGSDRNGLEPDPVHKPDKVRSHTPSGETGLSTASPSLKSPENLRNPSQQASTADQQNRVVTLTTPKKTEPIERWLDGTVNVSEKSSKKRKRSPTSIATPSPPPHISESFRNLDEIDFEMEASLTTPSKKRAAKSKLPSPPAASAVYVQKRLEAHNMYRDDDEAYNRYEAFQGKVQAILDGQRNSQPSLKSVERYQKLHSAFKLANEDSFLFNLMPVLIPTTRSVLRPVQISSQSSSPPAPDPSRSDTAVEDPHTKWMIEHYVDSGCATSFNTDFTDFFLPVDEELIALMNKDKDKEVGMTKPRPDLAFGLRLDKYKAPKDVKYTPRTQQLREVIPTMYDPMLVIEGKSDKGEIGVAENQASRSGSGLVNAARMLRERIGDPDVEGADDRTFLFSATLNPTVMELWVNWAEVSYFDKTKKVTQQGEETEVSERIKRVDYHMNLLASDVWRSDGFLKKYIAYFHNILDWGIDDRCKSNLEPLYQRVYAWERRGLEEASKEAHESSNNTSEGRASKRARSQT